MNPDRDRTEMPAARLDDERLGALVRSVADEWRLPPQRLDLPSWRERATSGALAHRPWTGRVVLPLSAALVATVVLAVAAVWLTSPRGQATVGKSPSPSIAPTPSAPIVTPLPKLVRNGALPSATRFIVGSEGSYRQVDLTTGSLSRSGLDGYGPQTVLAPLPGGGWLCLCVKWTLVGANGPTDLSLRLVAVDADGQLGATDEIRKVHGEPDPSERMDLQYEIADAAASLSSDGRTAFFAWTSRQGAAGWTSGIDVVDVTGAKVTSSTSLPVQRPAGTEGQPVTRTAPSVTLAPAGDRILVSGFWFVEAPNDPTPPAGVDRWTAAVTGGSVGTLSALPSTAAQECGEVDAGLIDSASYYIVCAGASPDTTVRRVGLDGSALGATVVPRTEEEFSAGSLVVRVGDGLYLWDPVAAILSRVNLATGVLAASTPPNASLGSGPLDALATLGRRFGRWIAPSAAAKLLLEPGIVVSPDGSRVYAIGVTSAAPSDRGSTGVFAFNAGSLALVGHWAPTADFTSIAISADGRFVYTAGLSGFDADGRSSSNGGSITVFDASDGSVRLIAGDLGVSSLMFLGATVR